MAQQELSLRHIRLVTKERPHDRFLTAQSRELTREKDKTSSGGFFFVVEITNPWFPNSQIGQTIINTVIREFRRGEYNSPLQNFEVALRKTNETLANITQTGETDWIGNLSSVIALNSGPHLYLAQTGKARAYLLRNGKIADLTEGLETEASQHPLTTYTNITSGTLEPGDRILLASSLLPETLSQAELKSLLTEETLPDGAREIIRALHREHTKRVHGFLVEAIPGQVDNEALGETMFVDQSPSHPLASAERLWRQHLVPSLKRGGSAMAQFSDKSTAWVKDSLVPRMLTWGTKSQRSLRQHTSTLRTKLTDKITERGKPELPSSTRPEKIRPDTEKNVRVHHYLEIAKRQNRLNFAWLKKVTLRLPKLTKVHLDVRRPQTRILGIAILVLIIVIASTTWRRNTKVTEEQNTNAIQSLADAKVSQQAAERAFVLGQKDSAKLSFLAAMQSAETALASTQTADEARVILTQSQNLFDQLIEATRLGTSIPSVTLPAVPAVINRINGTLMAAANTKVYEATLADATVEQTAEFASEPVQTVKGMIFADRWYLPGNQDILTYDPTTNTTSQAKLATGTWETPAAMASFGSTIYLLDSDAGQIWKHVANGNPINGEYGPASGYFSSPKPDQLNDAIDFAIDGDVFVLKSTGSVAKYTRGNLIDTWAINGIPTPWNQVSAPQAIFTNENTSTIYIYEGKTATHPARLIAFNKEGVYQAQLLFPSDWEPTIVSWNPVIKQGSLAVDETVYDLTWNQ